MVASRCASGIDAAIIRSLILTLSAAKAGVEIESANTPETWIMRASFSLSDIGSLLQPVGPGRPVTPGGPRSTTGVPARLAST